MVIKTKTRKHQQMLCWIVNSWRAMGKTHTQAFLREDQMQDSSVPSGQYYGDLDSHCKWE